MRRTPGRAGRSDAEAAPAGTDSHHLGGGGRHGSGRPRHRYGCPDSRFRAERDRHRVAGRDDDPHSRHGDFRDNDRQTRRDRRHPRGNHPAPGGNGSSRGELRTSGARASAGPQGRGGHRHAAELHGQRPPDGCRPRRVRDLQLRERPGHHLRHPGDQDDRDHGHRRRREGHPPGRGPQPYPAGSRRKHPVGAQPAVRERSRRPGDRPRSRCGGRRVGHLQDADRGGREHLPEQLGRIRRRGGVRRDGRRAHHRPQRVHRELVLVRRSGLQPARAADRGELDLHRQSDPGAGRGR